MSEIHCGTIAHVLADPFYETNALQIIENGALWLGAEGKIRAVGPRREIQKKAPDAELFDHGGAWLIPGLVDGHIHFPQFFATASGGAELLDWLHGTVFPAEAFLADETYARTCAQRFVARLLARGTTTAMVFGSQFTHATSALFHAARAKGLRMIAGITLMDRAGPPEVLTPPDQVFQNAETLIRQIEHEPLLDYAITPRFAISCSDTLLQVCRDLLHAYPRCYVQTHINENREEIQTVGALSGGALHYADVYDRAGLLTPGTILAHNIHPTDPELELLRARGCGVCHCPTSNAYLGSGLFPMEKHITHRVPILVGTDIGAGLHFSILRELGEVFKAQQLQRYRLDAARLLFLGTLAGARCLNIEERTGNFMAGKDGDFIVLSPQKDPYLRERLNHCDSLEDRLFALIHLHEPGHIDRTVIRGRTVYETHPHH